MNKLSSFVALCLLGTTINANAGDTAIRFGFDVGGDDIGEVQFSDGSNREFKFGTGLFIEVGYEFSTPVLNNNQLTTELYLGWKNDGSEAANGSVDYTRYLVGLTQYYKMDRLRFGLGIAHHFNNQFEIKGFDSMDVSLDHTIAVALTGDYQVTDRMKLGLRYNALNYEAPSSQTVDGSSIGFFLVFTD